MRLFFAIYIITSLTHYTLYTIHHTPYCPAEPYIHKKKEKSSRTSLVVPYDILFSNEYLRDLGRIWELREIVPDPNNMPWIEKIDK